MILATALLVCGCLLACEAQMEMEVEPALADMAQVDMANTLGCHRRLYRYKVTQSDSAGRSCWDNVNVMSCWGRCDSNEVRSKSIISSTFLRAKIRFLSSRLIVFQLARFRC
jgi:hypothetical protein